MDPRLALVAAEYRHQRDSLLAAFPELADDEQALTDTLDGVSDAVDVVSRFVRDALLDEAMASGLSGMLKDMGERKARLMSRADKRRAVALALMNAIGERKIERPDFTASVRAVPPKVEITDENALPDRFCKVVRSPDKTAIKEALRDGKPVLGAVLGNGSETLTILTR